MSKTEVYKLEFIGKQGNQSMEKILNVVSNIGLEERKAFLNDIKDVCEKYGIFFDKLTSVYFRNATVNDRDYSSSSPSPSSSSTHDSMPSLTYSSEEEGEYSLDCKLVGILFNITEKNISSRNVISSLEIPNEFVEKFRNFDLSKYEIKASGMGKNFLQVNHIQLNSELLTDFNNKIWCKELNDFIVNCEETVFRKEDLETKSHTELFDEFALAYSQKCVEKLNSIMEVGRQAFPIYFNKDSDNIVGRYLVGDTSMVDSLSKQIIQDTKDKKERDGRECEFMRADEIDLDPHDYLEKFAKSYLEKDFEVFSSNLENLEIGCRQWPYILNKDSDNIVGYFLRKEFDKVEYCANEMKKKSPITMEQAVKLYEKYTKNNAADLETYTQFYPLRELFSYGDWNPKNDDYKELTKIWNSLSKKNKICIKSMLG